MATELPLLGSIGKKEVETVTCRLLQSIHIGHIFRCLLVYRRQVRLRQDWVFVDAMKWLPFVVHDYLSRIAKLNIGRRGEREGSKGKEGRKKKKISIRGQNCQSNGCPTAPGREVVQDPLASRAVSHSRVSIRKGGAIQSP